MAHPASIPIEQLLADCDVKRQRRSGPGGQHRNKVETAIVITHRPSAERAEATERRSQEDNRKMAIFRLRLRLAVTIRCHFNAASAPSDLWRSRQRGQRISVSDKHDDFPALIAEALDCFASTEDVRQAADALGVSTSQFAKLLAQYPPALQIVNDSRIRQGLRKLK